MPTSAVTTPVPATTKRIVAMKSSADQISATMRKSDQRQPTGPTTMAATAGTLSTGEIEPDRMTVCRQAQLDHGSEGSAHHRQILEP